MMKFKIGKYIITLVALVTMFAAYGAEWNETHIYNPRWTPHAKFHNGQTMAFGTLLGALALYCLWVRRGDEHQNVKLAAVFAVLYWAAQSLAFLFPGVASFDAEFAASAPPSLFGVPGQLTLDIVIFVLLGVAYLMERKRITKQVDEAKRLTVDAHSVQTN